MKFLRSLSARMHLAMGLSSLTVSILMLAVFIKLIPNTTQIHAENRASIAESVASAVTLFLRDDNFNNISEHLTFLIDRNSDLVGSKILRVSDGSKVTLGDEGEINRVFELYYDQPIDSIESNSDQQFHSTRDILIVPLTRGGKRWGEVTLIYRPFEYRGIVDRLRNSVYAPVVFTGLVAFALFYWYLGRMLKQLNPSSAVPGRVRSALDTIAEALLVTDRNGEIVLANKAFSNLVGIDSENLVGKSSDSFKWEFDTSKSDKTVEIDHDSDSVTDGQSRTADDESTELELPWDIALSSANIVQNSLMWLEDHEGKRRKFLVNCSPVMGNDDSAGGVLISFDDITLLEEIELELIRSKEEAESANDAKSSFLSKMSHEIRTPMTAILGFTEVLRRGYDSDAQSSRKHLDTIASSGEHLLELINDILDISKVESGVLEVEEIPCKPYTVAHDVFTVLLVKANEQSIDLNINIESDLPSEILSDPSRVRQIITNLVGNAIKFTSEGQVDINIYTTTAIDGERIRFDIVDSGIGMTPEQCDSIFEAFVQADSSITRRFGGTGLGLSISKKLALALGGDIIVTSKPGVGSTFQLDLPCQLAEGATRLSEDELIAMAEQAHMDENSCWRIDNKSVLIVDDGAENRELLSLVLEEMGISIQCAENGKEGVDAYSAGEFDAILMDINMPVMDGYKAVSLLREMGAKIPVVALTANAMKGFETKVLEAGFSHYMTKPIDIDKLSNLLGELLDGRKESKSPKTENRDMTTEHVPDIADVSDELFNELTSKDPRFKPMADQFIDKLVTVVPAMQTAISAGDFKNLAQHAHWLKGSGGSVGFKAFTRPAEKLENAANAEDIPSMSEPMEKIQQLTNRLDPAADDNKVIHSSNEKEESVDANLITGTDLSSIGTVDKQTDDTKNTGSNSGAPIVSSLVSGNPRMLKIVESFIVTLKDRLPLIEKTVAEKNYEEIRQHAHWLKGSGGTVGFQDFTKPASRLEQLAIDKKYGGMNDLISEISSLTQRLTVIAPADDQSDELRKSA